MDRKLRLLVDLRPALQGFAGIPQEARLLFRQFCLDDEWSVEGFLQMQDTSLEPGILPDEKSSDQAWATAMRFHSLSQVVISVSEQRPEKVRTVREVIRDWIKRRAHKLKLAHGSVRIGLGVFESRHYEDFLWRHLFAKTLSSSDFALVTSRNHRVCSTSWEDMQDDGLDTLAAGSTPKYPVLDTSGYDIFIAHTPYPGCVTPGTTMVIRYHDAIPIFLPHTIAGKWKHEAYHFYALMSNVASGAWFSCVSESSRRELLRIFPEAADRTVTIHNMVSSQYFEEDSPFEEVRKIIPLRRALAISVHGEYSVDCEVINATFRSREDESLFFESALGRDFRYLLVVSTIDPRKNHATCITAWQSLKRTKDPNLKLIFVGSLGEGYSQLRKDLSFEVARGELFLLDQVPANELRILYRHASATICPSFAEGFDFSGVEAMRCGGVVVASDIAVHQEVYRDAAEYFDPYSTESACSALSKVIYDQQGVETQARLRKRGKEVSEKYLPENILPLWSDFFKELRGRRS